MMTETGYVASTEKTKQTSTTEEKQNTSLIITYMHRSEGLHALHVVRRGNTSHLVFNFTLSGDYFPPSLLLA